MVEQPDPRASSIGIIVIVVTAREAEIELRLARIEALGLAPVHPAQQLVHLVAQPLVLALARAQLIAQLLDQLAHQRQLFARSLAATARHAEGVAIRRKAKRQATACR